MGLDVGILSAIGLDVDPAEGLKRRQMVCVLSV